MFYCFLIGRAMNLPTAVYQFWKTPFTICFNGSSLCFRNCFNRGNCRSLRLSWHFLFYVGNVSLYMELHLRIWMRRIKIGAAGLVMAIVGGALIPKLQGMIIDLGEVV